LNPLASVDSILSHRPDGGNQHRHPCRISQFTLAILPDGENQTGILPDFSHLFQPSSLMAKINPASMPDFFICFSHPP
jgi:hypothetical protein